MEVMGRDGRVYNVPGCIQRVEGTDELEFTPAGVPICRGTGCRIGPDCRTFQGDSLGSDGVTKLSSEVRVRQC